MKFNSALTPLILLTLLGTLCLFIRWQLLGLSIDQFSSLEQLPKLKSSMTFGFLLWNIFLAWLPLFFALLFARSIKQGRPLAVSISLLVLWLAFLPNAPYILTDLLHLKWRHPVPHWFDLMTLIIFAWTGWQLGIASLIKIYQSLQAVLSKAWSISIVLIAIVLCAPGIYLGRVLRYNSWDLLHRPFDILSDLSAAMILPLETPGAGMIWMLIPFLLFTFWSQVIRVGSNTNPQA